jgi:hypothetical protein
MLEAGRRPWPWSVFDYVKQVHPAISGQNLGRDIPLRIGPITSTIVPGAF